MDNKKSIESQIIMELTIRCEAYELGIQDLIEKLNWAIGYIKTTRGHNQAFVDELEKTSNAMEEAIKPKPFGGSDEKL